MNQLDKGLIQIYTGDGLGKTTTAFGIALRALGHGFKVFIIQFMKTVNSGEIIALKRFTPECVIEQYGRQNFRAEGRNEYEDTVEAGKALAKARDVILSGSWDVVILDDIFNAVWFGLLKEKDILHILQEKPEQIEIILTGRTASKSIIEQADLVTEVVRMKHPNEKGIKARKETEF